MDRGFRAAPRAAVIQCAQDGAHGVGAGGDLRRLDLHLQFVLAGQLIWRWRCTSSMMRKGSTVVLAPNCSRASGFAGIDLDDAQRLRGQAQAVRSQQRLRGFGQFTETVDEFFLDADQVVFAVGMRRALVDGQAAMRQDSSPTAAAPARAG